MQDSQNQKIKQYLNSNVDLNTINIVHDDLATVKTVNIAQENAEKELNRLKKQLEKFNDVKKINEAKQLARELFNIQNEVNHLKAGEARCTIISRADTLKIILDSKDEISVYSFCKKRG